MHQSNIGDICGNGTVNVKHPDELSTKWEMRESDRERENERFLHFSSCAHCAGTLPDIHKKAYVLLSNSVQQMKNMWCEILRNTYDYFSVHIAAFGTISINYLLLPMRFVRNRQVWPALNDAPYFSQYQHTNQSSSIPNNKYLLFLIGVDVVLVVVRCLAEPPTHAAASVNQFQHEI